MRATVAEATADRGLHQPAPRRRSSGSGRSRRCCARAPAYGRGARTGERISLEFGSANPTGPLRRRSGPHALDRRHAGEDAALCRLRRVHRVDHQRRRLADGHARRVRSTRATGSSSIRRIRFPKKAIRATTSCRSRSASARCDGERWRTAPPRRVAAVLRDIRARRHRVASSRRSPQRFGVSFDLWQSEKALHEAGAIEAGIDRLRDLRAHLREGRRALAAHDRDRRRRGPRDRALRRPAGVLRQRRRLSLRQAAAGRSRDRHPRARPSRLHRAPAARWPTPTAATARSKS